MVRLWEAGEREDGVELTGCCENAAGSAWAVLYIGCASLSLLMYGESPQQFIRHVLWEP